MNTRNLIDDLMKVKTPSEDIVNNVFFAGAITGNTNYINWAVKHGATGQEIILPSTIRILTKLGKDMTLLTKNTN